jgi:chromosome segregation ATPase
MMRFSTFATIFAVALAVFFFRSVLCALVDEHQAELLLKDKEIAALQEKMVVLQGTVLNANLQLAEANKVSQRLSATHTAFKSKINGDAVTIQKLTTSTTDLLHKTISLKNHELEQLKHQMAAQNMEWWNFYHVAQKDWKKQLEARDKALLVAQNATVHMREAIDHALKTIEQMTRAAKERLVAMQHERAEHNHRRHEMMETIHALNGQLHDLINTKEDNDESMRYLALGNAGLSSEVMRLQREIASLDRAVESDDAEYGGLEYRNSCLEQRITELNDKVWELENGREELGRDNMDLASDAVDEDEIEYEIEEEAEDEHTDGEQQKLGEYILV